MALVSVLCYCFVIIQRFFKETTATFVFVTVSGSKIPKVVLGYDDHNKNVTTIQCIVTEADVPDAASLEKVLLLKDGIVLRSLTDLSVTLSLDVGAGEKHGGNYTCVAVVLFQESKYLNVSESTSTIIKGQFFQLPFLRVA